jgi:nitronate monooxygenase
VPALLDNLECPIVQAPMGGGPSTPRLAAAVAGAGGIGFLAGGYLSVEALAADVAATRELTQRFGVNLFVPGEPADADAFAAYLSELENEARRYGVEVGEARYSDDDFEAKLGLLVEERVPVVSFTFGLPAAGAILRLREAGSEAWVTVTGAEEARLAARVGPDALVVQGAEAGAHQGGFEDHEAEPVGTLALLQLVRAAVDLPLVASGGIATGAGVAAALAAGAAAAQVGTAFLLADEAGTAEAYREGLSRGGETRLTRAFTGRRARGLVNRFLDAHPEAPSAYPEVHNATAPIRAAARAAKDPEGINLWAGQAHELAVAEPAAEIVARLDTKAREALAQASARWPGDRA